MKEVIDRIFKRTTEYSHPSQATTIANSLELLSSGIYTEEERFVFELLQNAVDSYDGNSNGLNVRIVVGNRQLTFMHTGKAFSERDLEGLCDIGNGNKMSDAKKIGYKGIGFKSVFMHSKRVTVVTGHTCFRFDEEACKQLVSKRGNDYQGVKMPWQIIPILSDMPQGLDYDDYNVVTILEVPNTEKLLKKVERLLSDARFLLFLKVANLRVSLCDNNRELLSLSKTQEGNILTLAKNEVAQSRWLMFAEDVKIPAEVKEDLIHDAKTPSKLKDSDSVEISFAIALDDNGKITPLKDAVVYTYLPTSFSFGFEFVINANFITDAGRQQLIKDCEWNKFIFSQIPGLFLNWIKDEIAPNYKDWYKVHLPIKSDNDDLSIVYSDSYNKGLNTIPFIRTKRGDQILVKQALMDPYGLSQSLPSRIFDSFVHDNISGDVSINTLIEVEIGDFLNKLKISRLDKKQVYCFIEKSTKYLEALEMSEEIAFLTWLMEFSRNANESELSIYRFAKFIHDENNELQSPEALLFPSDFSDGREVVENAKIINKSLNNLFTAELRSWLANLGVKEISRLTLIEKVLCNNDAITADNSIEAIRFIFKTNLTENIFNKIPDYKLKVIKLLTSNGILKSPSELYLSDAYNPICKIQQEYPADIFVTTEYLSATDDTTSIREWSLFLKKLGVSEDIQLCSIDYTTGSWVMNNYTMQTKVELAKRTEYIHSYWTGNDYYLGCAGGVRVTVLSSPFFAPAEFKGQVEKNTFFKKVWERIFCGPLPSRNDDYIFGWTGNGYSARGYLSDSRYLGQSFIEWVAYNQKLVPASDGELYNAHEVLPHTNANIETFGVYFPVSSVETITEEWSERIKFKDNLTLNDYLKVLDRISNDKSKDQIKENIDRITRIYDRIADGGYNLVEGSVDFNILRQWGQTHKILSSEKEFEYPINLYLLSSRLSGIELDNQVYHRKNQENNRFADLMIALGVNMINNHAVEGLEDGISDNSINENLLKKSDFFAALTLGEAFSDKEWKEASAKMQNAISKLKFFKVPSIRVVYGRRGIQKTVYVKDSNVYFVGNFGLAVQELLHTDIVRLLGLQANDRSVFLTLLRMTEHEEMIEYLQMKGYNTQYISEPQLPVIPANVPVASMGGEDVSFGGLTTEQMRDALTEAKDAVLKQLEMDGYDISNSNWDGWTCIDGVRKGVTEFPLVIRSNKSGSNIRLNSTDWNQLMKPNAIFAMNTSDGIGTLNLKEVLKSRENITIRFRSDNIDKVEHVSKIADLLAYFRGIQFDFESYVRPAISRWQSFMAPELETGEQAEANPSIPLPE